MKRLVCILLALLMLAAMLPAGFAAAGDGVTPLRPDPDAPSGGHTHSWQFLRTMEEATCTSYGQAMEICYGCGATQMIYINMLPHTWGEWEILTEATDHSAGERQRICEVCGKTETEKYYPEGTILPGTTGPEVEKLQDLLNENGIPAPQDGEYGDATREAVREAQRQNGLEADGTAWPQTIDCLRHQFGEWEVLREPALTKPGLRHRICEKCGYEEKEDFVRELGPGARGDFVKWLQGLLEKLGYYNGRRDGDYGPAVSKAVEDFQREHGLEPTGIADEETLNLIAAEAEGNNRDSGDTDTEPDPVSDGIPNNGSDYIPEPDPDPLPDPNPVPDPYPEPAAEPSVLYIPEEIKSGIQVTKTVTSTPGGGRSYYTKDEVIDYLIEVRNIGNTVITEAVVTDSMNGGPNTEIASIENFYPSGTRQYYYHYTVTDADVSGGFATVTNSAFAAGTDEYNNGVYGEDYAESRVGPVDSEPQRPYLTKEVANKPKNGSFFVEGEQINFEIIVHNPSDLDIVYASIQDGFNGGPLIWIASVAAPAHTDSVPVPYCHYVTAEEAAAGKVTNLAIADCNFSDYSFIQIGDTAEAPTGVEKAETGSEAFSDCCVRTLTGKGDGIAEYTLSYCHIHEPIAEQVRALAAAAGGNPDESVWKQAAVLWRAAIDEEYAGLHVSDDYRNAFYAWIEEYEACLKAEYPEDGATVAMLISEQLMNTCADLCYLNGTAPADRTDSLITGSYQTLTAAEAAENCFRAVTDGTVVSYAEILCGEHRAADTELIKALSEAKTNAEQADALRNNKQSWLNALSRHTSEAMSKADTETAELILNERNAFGKMLQAKEMFLAGFYPDRPEAVQEILMNTVRGHVIDCCK